MSEAMRSAPDWLVLGVSIGQGKVWVIATDKITVAELARHDDVDVGRFAFRDFISAPVRYTFDAEFDSFVMAEGATYAEAVAKLFGTWAPAEPGQTGLPSPTPELGP